MSMAFARNNQRGGSGSGPRRRHNGGFHNKSRNSQREPLVTVKGRSDQYMLYGWHSVMAALANPHRRIKRLLATESAIAQLQENKSAFERAQKCGLEKTTGDVIAQMLRSDVPHQGIAAEVQVLPETGMEVISASAKKGPVVILDQVTDPHNVGAILRSAAAFDCPAIVTTQRNSAPESGALARAAAGALETVPYVRVANLVQAMLALKSAGYWIIGFDADAKEPLHKMKLDGKLAILLGAEGKGMRRLTTEHCDMIAKIPMSDAMESLNVSNAAAIAMYECYKD